MELTPEQIDTFKRDGVLVVEDVLTPEEVEATRAGFVKWMKEQADIDVVETNYNDFPE